MDGNSLGTLATELCVSHWMLSLQGFSNFLHFFLKCATELLLWSDLLLWKTTSVYSIVLRALFLQLLAAFSPPVLLLLVSLCIPAAVGSVDLCLCIGSCAVNPFCC